MEQQGFQLKNYMPKWCQSRLFYVFEIMYKQGTVLNTFDKSAHKYISRSKCLVLRNGMYPMENGLKFVMTSARADHFRESVSLADISIVKYRVCISVCRKTFMDS